jgi:hypothetical protein
MTTRRPWPAVRPAVLPARYVVLWLQPHTIVSRRGQSLEKLGPVSRMFISHRCEVVRQTRFVRTSWRANYCVRRIIVGHPDSGLKSREEWRQFPWYLCMYAPTSVLNSASECIHGYSMYNWLLQCRSGRPSSNLRPYQGTMQHNLSCAILGSPDCISVVLRQRIADRSLP